MNHTIPMAVNNINRLVVASPDNKQGKNLIVKLVAGHEIKSADVEPILFCNSRPQACQSSHSHYNFKHLDDNKRYTLQVKIAAQLTITVFSEQQLSDLTDPQKITALNIGVNGGPQLLSHTITAHGHIELTLLTEPPSFGVFFDGTGNNRINDNIDLEDDKEPTNITKLYELYPRGELYGDSYYVEGIGTEAYKSDSILDLAIASSFDERVLEALKELQEFIDQQDYIFMQLVTVDVFGFSRGATAARAFVNQIYNITVNNPNYWGNAKPMIRFLGPFDTVSSIGGDGDDNHNEFYASDNLPYRVNIDISTHSAGVVYHPVAYDEYRDNFPLHTLQDASGNTPSNIIEVALPGAHADVGGGYSTQQTHINFPRQHLVGRRNNPGQHAALQALKAQLEQEYAWPGINIEFKAKAAKLNQGTIRRAPNAQGQMRRVRDNEVITPYQPFWRRSIDNSLPHYALHKMHQIAKDNGVPFYPLSELDTKRHKNGKKLYPYELSKSLKSSVEHAIMQGPVSVSWDTLREHYIHHSHKYTGFVNGLANGKEEKALHTTGNGVREVFYNDPANAAINIKPFTKYQLRGKTVWLAS
ncbi:hypothetical protein PCIT_a0004 [Pseudoalteromonas citrea]|uniref:T6SS Phospholipase effector Tle1-like catalytic domain-containing protein n=2 Tax=Pseudoalteromonas citrea TaxID=43655 RepID=A0AAD4AK58_9GAMM|nr:DUF2235 domain-containing protein [Pseudoalteromonas citrea]KAF7773700.1 hypothetical protein PCIT_a0004 [Pseudoalteromonas citrea]